MRHVFHETYHFLGFFHEHERPDRDLFVTVHEQNIEPGRVFKLNFELDWIDTFQFSCFEKVQT